jgi:hypothetical protein
VIHEAATLTASDGAALSHPIVSGATIVARGPTDNAPGSVYVFTEPPGGWSGSIHESAKLTASDGYAGDDLGSSVAVSDDTIVAGAPFAKVGADAVGAVYVFTRPSGGWSGALHETAKLTGSDVSRRTGLVPFSPYFGSAVALSGDTVVASRPFVPGSGGDGGAAYVFVKPAAGWSSETETAKLQAPGNVLTAGSPLAGVSLPGDPVPQLAVSGDTIVLPGSQGSTLVHPSEFVYTRPPGGWSGTENQSATLTVSNSSPSDSSAFGHPLGSPLIGDHAVIAGALAGADAGTVVATGSAYVFNEPPAGWAGTLDASARLEGTPLTPSVGTEYLFAQPEGGWTTAAPDATLTPSGVSQQVGFSSIALSGDTAVASGDNAAYVFARPAGGWSAVQPAAQLLDSSGDGLGAVAMTGATIAAIDQPPQNVSPHRIDLFNRPASGWAGNVHEAASLVASDGASFTSVAASGQDIAAVGSTATGTSVYVFREPAGGWSGIGHEIARLPESAGSYGILGIDGNTIVEGGVISGTTVVAASSARVLTAPAGGWSAGPASTATLTPPRWATHSVYVYTEPVAGWSGVLHPAARLIGGTDNDEVAIAGFTVAVGSFEPPHSRYDSCPCSGGVQLFAEPTGGWHGILTAPQSLSTTTVGVGSTLAIDGDTLISAGLIIPRALAGPQGIPTDTGVFAIPTPIVESIVRPGPPTVGQFQVNGLRTGRPRLAFTLTAGSYAPPLESMRLALPSGLRFNDRTDLLRTAVKVKHGALGSARIIRHRLVLSVVVSRIATVYIRRPALVETKAFLGHLRRTLHRRRRHGQGTVNLRFSLRVTDAAGTRTPLVLWARVH